MICNTAVSDGLLDYDPCDVRGAMNPKTQKRVKIATTVELHAIADKLDADENNARFKALVSLAGWCGLRFGEVSELRRKDFERECEVLTVTRAVTHRADPNADESDSAAKAGRSRIDSTKGNEDERAVTIPPHIRDEVKITLRGSSVLTRSAVVQTGAWRVPSERPCV